MSNLASSGLAIGRPRSQHDHISSIEMAQPETARLVLDRISSSKRKMGLLGSIQMMDISAPQVFSLHLRV
jgi:hypothetical protein